MTDTSKLDPATGRSTLARLISRRRFTQAAGIGACAGMLAPLPLLAQDNVLPLDTPGLDHLDVVVEDVEATARFYMALFDTVLHAQPFRGAQRYFILLGELNDRREVGYLAIGASNGRGTYIGHFCTSVANWRRDADAIWAAMSREIYDAGLGRFPGATGFGGIFDDPDGIEIQFLPAPDTLVTAAVPSDLVAHHQGPVTPLGVDHVVLNVSDLERALAFYRILYGPESIHQERSAIFDFPRSGTRLELREIAYEYGTAPGIASFGIKVRPMDRQAVVRLLNNLGATVLPLRDPDPEAGIQFIDPDGIRVDLNPV